MLLVHWTTITRMDSKCKLNLIRLLTNPRNENKKIHKITIKDDEKFSSDAQFFLMLLFPFMLFDVSYVS